MLRKSRHRSPTGFHGRGRGFRYWLAAAFFLACCCATFAWDVEHDELAQLVGETLPEEIKSFYTFDDFGTLLEYCHFPDMTEWAPHRFRTLDDIEEVVGRRDRDVIASRGFFTNWMHTEDGKATFMTLLARAFARGESHKAAFYLSVLTHQVGDESALNHPPLLDFVRFCRIEGVDLGVKNVEHGAKNDFGFRSDGLVVRLAREKLRGYRPKLPPAEGFREQVLWHCLQVVPQRSYAAEKETEIGFAKCDNPSDALADLLAMQVKALVDITWTCWVNRSAEAPLPAEDFKDRFDSGAAELEDKCDPAKQAVFGDLFDMSRNPSKTKGMVGVICESLGSWDAGAQSYVGRIVAGACGRTLRDNGWAVKGISLRGLKDGDLSASDTPVVIAALGNDAPTAEQAAAIVAFRKAGGRLIYISGQNPTAEHDRKASGRPLVVGKGDPLNVTGLADFLVDRACEEVPASPGWASEGACRDWRKMRLDYAGKRYPLRHNANCNGNGKAVCAQEVQLAEGIEPIAYLDNGKDRFCVAARRANVTWLPIYMLSPFLFSEDTSLDFGALRLDSFAERVLLNEMGRSSEDRSLAARGGMVYETFFGPIRAPKIPARDFPAAAYGVVGDGETSNTEAFRTAIDACVRAGGGRVTVAVGTYLTGPIHLKSNVALHLDEGATILFSDEKADYLPPVRVNWEGTECLNYSPLVYAYGATNIAITGRGRLKALTKQWYAGYYSDKADGSLDRKVNTLRAWGEDDTPLSARDATLGPGTLRPHLVQFNRSANIIVEGISWEDSPFWCFNFVCCENVVCRDLTGRAHGHNTDGIDPEGTRNMLVENVCFDQGDDVVAIKAGRDRDGRRVGCATENFEMRNCRVLNGHSLVACGSELSGGIRNVWVHDCHVVNAAGLCYMKSNRARGGTVEDIRVSDIMVDNVYVWLCGLSHAYSPNPYAIERHGVHHTRFRRFTMENIRAKYGAIGIRVLGTEDNPAEDFTFRNIVVETSAPEASVEIQKTSGVTVEGVRFGKYRPVATNGVLCLTFDGALDAYRPLLPVFRRHDAHATFFVRGTLDRDSVSAFTAEGHTVGLNGLAGLNAVDFVMRQGGTPEEYIACEIEPQLASARAAGLEPKHWAYPEGDCNDVTDGRIAFWHFRRNRSETSDLGSATIGMGDLPQGGAWMRTLYGYRLDSKSIDAAVAHLPEVARTNGVFTTVGGSFAEVEALLGSSGRLGIKALGFDELSAEEAEKKGTTP